MRIIFVPLLFAGAVAGCAIPMADQVAMEESEMAALNERWEAAYLQLEDWLTDCNGAIRSRAALVYYRHPEIQRAAVESFSREKVDAAKNAWGSEWGQHIASRLANYAVVASPSELDYAIRITGASPSKPRSCSTGR